MTDRGEGAGGAGTEDPDPGGRLPSRPGDRESGAGGHGTCDLCGGPTIERHCKIVCRRCGYQRDCSDP